MARIVLLALVLTCVTFAVTATFRLNMLMVGAAERTFFDVLGPTLGFAMLAAVVGGVVQAGRNEQERRRRRKHERRALPHARVVRFRARGR